MRGTKQAVDESARNRLISAWAKEVKTQLDHLLPKFDQKNKVHQRLSELSAKAHDLVRNQEPGSRLAVPTGTTKNQELSSVEAEIDQQSAWLWNLTGAELAEIQRSLKELTE